MSKYEKFTENHKCISKPKGIRILKDYQSFGEWSLRRGWHIIEVEPNYEYGGYCNHDVEEISFCPFCGMKLSEKTEGKI